MEKESSKEIIFEVQAHNFEAIALDLFRYQAQFNPIYARYIQFLGIDWQEIDQIKSIPFLPIAFFRDFSVKTGHFNPTKIFESSGTTGQLTSKHFVRDTLFYQKLSVRIFESFYGPLHQYHILALLPSYLERNNSSLVFMVDHFIKMSQSDHSGFYLEDRNQLIEKIRYLKKKDDKRQILLLGVSFALLDLAEEFPENLSDIVVMETGGMKGRRKEMLREELHKQLKNAFGLDQVHSEYGMTELLSQAYSLSKEVFRTPPWMKVLVREINDPFSMPEQLSYGALNIIDLANWDSCAFIATDDLGKSLGPDTFQVLGRIDHSDVRGCNLLYL